jgi:hypothetical protein
MSDRRSNRQRWDSLSDDEKQPIRRYLRLAFGLLFGMTLSFVMLVRYWWVAPNFEWITVVLWIGATWLVARCLAGFLPKVNLPKAGGDDDNMPPRFKLTD